MFNRTICLVFALLLLPVSARIAALEADTNAAMDPQAIKVMADTSAFLNTFNEVSMHAEGTVEKVFF